MSSGFFLRTQRCLFPSRPMQTMQPPRLNFMAACALALFCGLYAVPAFAQNIQVSPSSLSATVVKGQSTTLILSLRKTGGEQHIWEPKASVGWMTLSPAYGSANTITTELDQLRLTVNSSGMALGTNTGLIYLWESGPGVSRRITVPVIITVSQTGTTTPPSSPPSTPPPPPSTSPPPASPPPPPPASPPPPPGSLNSTITAFPAALSATVVKGQSTTLAVNLQKTGTAQHVWEPKTNVGWMMLSPAYGSANTITTERDQLRLTINSSGMALGTHSGLIYIWEAGPGVSRMTSVPVTVTVSQTGTTTPPSPPPNTPPPPASPPPPSSPPPASPPPPPSSLNSTITAFPSALTATVVKGQSTTLAVNLQKTGTAQHVWEPKTNVGWITLSPAYGSANTITTELDQVRATINSSGMALGTHSGLIYIWESGPGVSRTTSVPVTVTVSQSGTTTPPSPPPPKPIGGVSPPPPPPPSPTNGTATVTWAANSENDLAGYKLYVGTASGIYTRTVDVGKVTSYSITLPKGSTYFFALTAYDRSGNESGRSAEMSRSLY